MLTPNQSNGIIPGEHRCDHCGWIGKDVVLQTVHVGGRGYVDFHYCKDQRACWRRDERQAKAREEGKAA